MELAIRHPTDIAMYKFNRTEEGKTGADWIWCITDGHEWFEMLIQAKKLDQSKMIYPHVNRTIGNSTVRQIDRLVNVSRASDVTPMYCFYNYFDVGLYGPFLQLCCMTMALCGTQFGCSMAYAPAVRMLQSHSFSSVSKISCPWHCVVCCFLQDGLSFPCCVRNACLALQALGGAEDAVSNIKNAPPSYIEVLERGPIDGVEPFEGALREAMGEGLQTLVDGILRMRVER